MKMDELLLLLKAGYTKSDIDALTADPKPEQPADPKPDDDRLSKLETTMDYLVNRLNYLAVKGTDQPDQKHQQTADEILESIIKGVTENGK